jgi:hypothetical protein
VPEEVRYPRKGGHESTGFREREVAAFDPGEFLARVVMHIPEHAVVDAIHRHLAKTEARSPHGPPGAAVLPTTS